MCVCVRNGGGRDAAVMVRGTGCGRWGVGAGSKDFTF